MVKETWEVIFRERKLGIGIKDIRKLLPSFFSEEKVSAFYIYRNVSNLK